MSDYLVKNKVKISVLTDSLFKNSLYIMTASIFNAVFGFIFWILAAKIYPKEDVGIATVLVSSMGLLILLSRAGMDFSIIRFISEKNKDKILNTCVVVTTLLVIVLGMIFILGIDIFSPKIYLLKNSQNSVLFMLILVINSFLMITGNSFIGTRKSSYYLLQTLSQGSRILFLAPLVSLGAIGIFGSVGFSFLFGFLISLTLLKRLNHKLEFTIDKKYIRETFSFSATNYVISVFMAAPSMMLSIIALNILGAENAAYYYVVYSISSLLIIIPNSISMSLFVEGCHGEELKKTVLKALFFILSIMIPIGGLLYFFGDWVLLAFGKDYSASGVKLLQEMVIASYLIALNYVYCAIKRVQKDTKGLFIINAVIFSLLVVLSYIFMLYFGLNGIGHAWIASYGIGFFAMIIMIWKEKWFSVSTLKVNP